MSAQDATIFLAAAIAFIIPLAGYAAHLHYEAKRQVGLAKETHERERLQARKNALENLLLLAKAMQDQQVNYTEGCLRVRVFLDLLEEGNFESIMYNDDCDGIHPNQEFITNVMAPQIANFIKDNYQ